MRRRKYISEYFTSSKADEGSNFLFIVSYFLIQLYWDFEDPLPFKNRKQALQDVVMVA